MTLRELLDSSNDEVNFQITWEGCVAPFYIWSADYLGGHKPMADDIEPLLDLEVDEFWPEYLPNDPDKLQIFVRLAEKPEGFPEKSPEEKLEEKPAASHENGLTTSDYIAALIGRECRELVSTATGLAVTEGARRAKVATMRYIVRNLDTLVKDYDGLAVHGE